MTKIKYCIFDSVNNAALKRVLHYGYTNNNKQVFEARFTDNLDESMIFESKEQAKKTLGDMLDNTYHEYLFTRLIDKSKSIFEIKKIE